MSAGPPDDDLREILRGLEAAPRDAKAWERFFMRLWPFVRAAAYHALAGSPQRVIDAEDVAQEVFIHFARLWHSGRDPRPATGDHVRHLLALMARRQGNTARRLLLRERRDARRDQPLPEDGDLADTRPLVQALVEYDDLLARILADLGPEDQLLVRRLIAGHTEKDIAGELGVTDRTIRRRLIGVREAIRKHLLTEDLG